MLAVARPLQEAGRPGQVRLERQEQLQEERERRRALLEVRPAVSFAFIYNPKKLMSWCMSGCPSLVPPCVVFCQAKSADEAARLAAYDTLLDKYKQAMHVLGASPQDPTTGRPL